MGIQRLGKGHGQLTLFPLAQKEVVESSVVIVQPILDSLHKQDKGIIIIIYTYRDNIFLFLKIFLLFYIFATTASYPKSAKFTRVHHRIHKTVLTCVNSAWLGSMLLLRSYRILSIEMPFSAHFKNLIVAFFNCSNSLLDGNRIISGIV